MKGGPNLASQPYLSGKARTLQSSNSTRSRKAYSAFSFSFSCPPLALYLRQYAIISSYTSQTRLITFTTPHLQTLSHRQIRRTSNPLHFCSHAPQLFSFLRNRIWQMVYLSSPPSHEMATSHVLQLHQRIYLRRYDNLGLYRDTRIFDQEADSGLRGGKYRRY